MTLDQPVDTIFAALKDARPRLHRYPARGKVHEVVISEEESHRTVPRSDFLVVKPLLPELAGVSEPPALPRDQPFSSADHLLDAEAIQAMLRRNDLLVDQTARGGLEVQPA